MEIPGWVLGTILSGLFWAGLIMLGWLMKFLDDRQRFKDLNDKIDALEDKYEKKAWRGTKDDFEKLSRTEDGRLYIVKDE